MRTHLFPRLVELVRGSRILGLLWWLMCPMHECTSLVSMYSIVCHVCLEVFYGVGLILESSWERKDPSISRGGLGDEKLTCLGEFRIPMLLFWFFSVADDYIHKRMLEFLCVFLMCTANSQVSFEVGYWFESESRSLQNEQMNSHAVEERWIVWKDGMRRDGSWHVALAQRKSGKFLFFLFLVDVYYSKYFAICSYRSLQECEGSKVWFRLFKDFFSNALVCASMCRLYVVVFQVCKCQSYEWRV